MHARSTTVRGNPQRIDQATAYLRDKLMPAVTGLDGFVGLSMMADRATGRCIATTSWASEESMRDSDGPLHQLRRRYGEILGGQLEVQEWEIAVVHRLRLAPEGACARVIWMQTEPANVDSGMEVFRVSLLSRMEDLPGFCSISILIDRRAGRAVSSTVYENRAAMDEAVGMATPMREGFSRQMGVEITEVGEFDLVLAHLRVPETV
jgi:hypothetical protein